MERDTICGLPTGNTLQKKSFVFTSKRIVRLNLGNTTEYGFKLRCLCINLPKQDDISKNRA